MTQPKARRTGTTVRNLLSTTFVRKVTEPKKYPDGGNLYLQVQKLPNGAIGKSWIFRYLAADGRRPEMGLGPLLDVGMADARAQAAHFRQMLRDGLDPLQERHRKRQDAILAASRAITFEGAGEAYIKAHAPSWKNEKHKSQWENTLATYANPIIGKLLVADIDSGHAVQVMHPIWGTKHETARRLRARCERVMAWATTSGYRSGDNPFRWDGNLKELLAKTIKAAPVKHHPALPYDDIHDFIVELRREQGVAARALELVVLTATRTSEVINATWDEINFERGEWVIPGARMKSGKEHRVPLSDAAVTVLGWQKGMDETWIFPGMKAATPLSNMAMLELLKRMGRKGITVHGFRSTFRDWAAEQTAFPNHVVEMALAHAIGDKVEAAYRRGQLIQKRTQLMQKWASYIDQKPGTADVTPIRNAGRELSKTS